MTAGKRCHNRCAGQRRPCPCPELCEWPEDTPSIYATRIVVAIAVLAGACCLAWLRCAT